MLYSLIIVARMCLSLSARSEPRDVLWLWQR